MKITSFFGTRWWILCVLVAFAAANGRSRAAEPPRAASEYQVKAAFLLNFGRFTEWPPRTTAPAAAPINLCVVGHDPFGGDLDQVVENQSIHDRPIHVVRYPSGTAPSGCQILFVGSPDRLTSILSVARRNQCLTVSDLPGFLEAGGMVQLFVEGSHVRFSINLQAARSAGLQLSSKLLQIAKAVQ